MDTTPTNFLHLGLILTLDPTARIVHVKRDPLDTCLSIYQQALSSAHSYANTMQDLGAYYRLYQDLMSHWKTIAGDRLYELRYEDLVENSEQEIRRLLEFCKLKIEPACFEPHRNKRAIYTPSASQVRQPIHSASVGRAAAYGKLLDPLMQALEK